MNKYLHFSGSISIGYTKTTKEIIRFSLQDLAWSQRSYTMFENLHAVISNIFSHGNVICFFQEIDVEVELTANHWGRFEMFLCPNNNPRYEATQPCLDRLEYLHTPTSSTVKSKQPRKDLFCTPPYLGYFFKYENCWSFETRLAQSDVKRVESSFYDVLCV